MLKSAAVQSLVGCQNRVSQQLPVLAPQAAEADVLRDAAAELVGYQNRERTEDVLRIAAFSAGRAARSGWRARSCSGSTASASYLFAATVGGAGAQVLAALMKCMCIYVLYTCGCTLVVIVWKLRPSTISVLEPWSNVGRGCCSACTLYSIASNPIAHAVIGCMHASGQWS